MSAAKEIYDGINTEADLEAFRLEGREEGLHLEFKTKNDRTRFALHDDDRKNIAKSLSAFANSDGGVLVFGVATARNANQADSAMELVPIQQFAEFARSISGFLKDATSPIVDGVDIRPIPSAADAGAGYVVILIPQSLNPPHRSERTPRSYWRRVRYGCAEMEHYEIADMFGRRLRPKLRVRFVLSQAPALNADLTLNVMLLNKGHNVAKHASVWCRLHSYSIVRIEGPQMRNSAVNFGAQIFSAYYPTDVVHANSLLLHCGTVFLRRTRAADGLRATVVVSAEDMESATFDIDIPVDQAVEGG